MFLPDSALLLWIIGLMLIEVVHLRWIWWEHWHCRGCKAVNRRCGCGRAERIMRL